MRVLLEIENVYSEIGVINTQVETEIAAPPAEADEAAFEDWLLDEILPHTGAGHEGGDANYYVKVAKCDEQPALVGRTFEL